MIIVFGDGVESYRIRSIAANVTNDTKIPRSLLQKRELEKLRVNFLTKVDTIDEYISYWVSA